MLSTDIQPSDQQELALICLTIITIHALDKKPPPTTDDISIQSGLPAAFFLKTLQLLKNAGYIYRTDEIPSEYILSVSPKDIRLKNIMESAIEHTNDKDLPLVSNKNLWQESIKICAKHRDSFTNEANPTLLEIAQRLEKKIG